MNVHINVRLESLEVLNKWLANWEMEDAPLINLKMGPIMVDVPYDAFVKLSDKNNYKHAKD